MIGNVNSKIAGKFSELAEANKGKGPLDPQEEYLFELVTAEAKQIKGWQSEEDKKAGKPAAKKTHAATTWQVVTPGTGQGVQVFQKFNIETLSKGKGPTDSMRSKVIKFMEDIGISQTRIESILKDAEEKRAPDWDSIFIPTMKIRARIVKSDKPDEYFFNEGSFRAYKV